MKNESKKLKILLLKYYESNGIYVLTPEKTYSKERKDEFKMRDWFELDRMKEF